MAALGFVARTRDPGLGFHRVVVLEHDVLDRAPARRGDRGSSGSRPTRWWRARSPSASSSWRSCASTSYPFVSARVAPLAPPAAGTSVTRVRLGLARGLSRALRGSDRRPTAPTGRARASSRRCAPSNPTDPRGVAVFIPPSNREFWKMDEPWACRRRPSYVPALTGLPLVKGVGPYYCPLWVSSLDNGYSELRLLVAHDGERRRRALPTRTRAGRDDRDRPRVGRRAAKNRVLRASPTRAVVAGSLYCSSLVSENGPY